MVSERFERGEKWWQIVYGYGRIQRVRAAFARNLPEAARRALIADPDLTTEELTKKVSVEEIATYNEIVGREVVSAVLQGAHDLGGKSIMEYVDDCLPEDVGVEIVERMRAIAFGGTDVPHETKKN